MSALLGDVRAFLVNGWSQWALPRLATDFFRNVTTHFFNIFHHASFGIAHHVMQTIRRDSKATAAPEPKRHMVHLKTKEECRLGNETIQVWTVELPSKHAEGILKSVSPTLSFPQRA